MQYIEAYRNASVRELNHILTRMKIALDIDKNRANELSQLRKTNEAHFWWTCPFDRMNMVQLGSFEKDLEDLQKLVAITLIGLKFRVLIPNPFHFLLEMVHPLTCRLSISQILNKIRSF